MAKGNETHTVMPKKLAQALIESGMHHFSLGGLLGATDGYVATAPSITKQDDLTENIGQLQGRGNDIYNQQQSLGNQLLAQTQGQGPNPALAQLQQTTGQNVSNQAALMAGQRGASANPALIARQAAQQGAATQQQAVGQGATLGAQQQLAAQTNLANLQNNIANQNLQGQTIDQNALASQNSAVNTAQLGTQGINAGAAATNAQVNGGIIGGLLGGAGAALGAIFHDGGEVEKLNAGGVPFSKALLNGGKVPGKAAVPGNSIKNDNEPTLLSPGEEVIDRETMQDPGPVGQAARFVASHINAKNEAKDANPQNKAAEFMKHLMDKKESEGGSGYKKVVKAKQKVKNG